MDYETIWSYTVTVIVTDPSGARDTITVTVDVNNVDEDGRAFSFSGLGYIGPVFPAKAGIHITAAYGNFPMARLYGFPPARE